MVEKSRARAEDGCKKTKVVAGQRAWKSKLDTALVEVGQGSLCPMRGLLSEQTITGSSVGRGGLETATIITVTFSAAPFPGAGPDPGALLSVWFSEARKGRCYARLGGKVRRRNLDVFGDDWAQ